MPIHLRRIALHPWGGPLPTPLHTPAGTWTRREGLLVWIELSDGSEGLGEASPLPGFSRESLDAAWSALRAWSATVTTTRPRLATDAPLQQVARLTAPLVAWPSAAFAAQSALLDAMARGAGRPLHELLAPTDTLLTTSLHNAAWLGTLPMDEEPLSDLRHRIESQAGEGARAFKLKSASLPDPSRLGVVLNELPPTARLRLDLQGRPHDPAEVSRWLIALGGEPRIEAVEEPLQVEHWPSAPWPGTSAPVARDESLLHWPPGRRPLRLAHDVASGRCHGVVLKPALLGGIVEAERLARTALASGGAFTFTHLLDGPVARAAVAELALALRPPWSVGLGPHPASAAFPQLPHPAALRHRFLVSPHEEPGLGLSLRAVRTALPRAEVFQ